MKKPTATALLLALLASVNLPGQAPDRSLQEEVAEFTSMELIETWGYLLAERFNLEGLEVTDAEIEVIARGMMKYINREDPPTDLSRSINPVQNYWLQREGIVREEQKKRNEEAEVEFFDTLVGRPEYQSLATGLFFQILEPGSNEKPSKNDRVRCHYLGTFLDGTEFDNSYNRDEPSDFSLAAATALAMPITAYLVAVYIGSTGTTPRPAVEAVMVMAPPCFPIFGKKVVWLNNH